MRLIIKIFTLSLFLLHSWESPLGAEENKSQCKDFAKREIANIPGWCTPKKAEAMMDLIFETTPNVCVELGVFAGSSLLPTAIALKHSGNGVVYAIDAWDVQEAIKYYPTGSPHRDWWGQQNMDTYYNFFLNIIAKHGLESYCIILKMPFRDALKNIGSIDILHIDATHTKEGDFIDVLPYVAKVRNGGYIWFDGWANSPDLYDHLKKDFIVKKVINSGNCILLKKNSVE